MLNHYFSKGTQNEQFLYEDLVIEALQIYGHDVVYLPRELVNKDDLFGEDPLSKFDESYQIEMYMETVEGYEGEKELVSRFGLEIRDETTFVVARRRWDNVISISQNLITSMRPNEGDLIFMPNVNRIWEIAFVDIDDPFYQVDNLPVYKMFCRTFEYSSERLDTGISVIDNIETTYSTDQLTWQMIGEAAATVTYNENMASEDVSGGLLMQEDGTTGAGLGDNLTAEDEVGFDAVLLENSNAYDSYFIISEEFELSTQDDTSDNKYIEDQAADRGVVWDGDWEGILDFTEKNPFGEPTEKN
jgi:hypothetical protein|tara:strand:+ start:1116 stop:2021 length:906 start_codon:yes stop_codon:yes gene_type:complete